MGSVVKKRRKKIAQAQVQKTPGKAATPEQIGGFHGAAGLFTESDLMTISGRHHWPND